MHTVQLLLKTSKYERHEIDRRFHALAHLHNVCVKHARKCMIRLQHDKRYAELRQLYNELVKKEKMSKEEKSQKKKLAKQLAACRTEQGLSKASLEHYLKVCGKQFSKLLSSQGAVRILSCFPINLSNWLYPTSFSYVLLRLIGKHDRIRTAP